MASMKRPRLASAKPLADFRMELTFIDGSVFTVDFTPFCRRVAGSCAFA